jgi:hypothetical protein
MFEVFKSQIATNYFLPFSYIFGLNNYRLHLKPVHRMNRSNDAGGITLHNSSNKKQALSLDPAKDKCSC